MRDHSGWGRRENTYREMNKRMCHCISPISHSQFAVSRSREEERTFASPAEDEWLRSLEHVLDHDRLPVIPVPHQLVFEEIHVCALVPVATMNNASQLVLGIGKGLLWLR